MKNNKKWTDPHKGNRVTAYIDDYSYQELKKLCEATGASLTDAVRAAIACLISSSASESLLVSSMKMHGYRKLQNQTKGDK